MNDVNSYEGDLQYVREVVERAESRRAPASIYYLWAVICLVGFPLNDFAPMSSSLFWIIAAPVGFVISAIIGWRYSKTLGQVSRREGIFAALHWLGTLIAISLVSLLVINNVLAPSGIPQVILLILALSYFTAGLYQDRPMLWISIMLALAYVAVALIRSSVWTVLGVAIAASFVASAIIGARRGQR